MVIIRHQHRTQVWSRDPRLDVIGIQVIDDKWRALLVRFVGTHLGPDVHPTASVMAVLCALLDTALYDCTGMVQLYATSCERYRRDANASVAVAEIVPVRHEGSYVGFRHYIVGFLRLRLVRIFVPWSG